MNEKDLAWLVPCFTLGTLFFMCYAFRLPISKHWKTSSVILFVCLFVCMYAIEQSEKVVFTEAARDVTGVLGSTWRMFFGTLVATMAPIVLGEGIRCLANSIKAKKQRT